MSLRDTLARVFATAAERGEYNSDRAPLFHRIHRRIRIEPLEREPRNPWDRITRAPGPHRALIHAKFTRQAALRYASAG